MRKLFALFVGMIMMILAVAGQSEAVPVLDQQQTFTGGGAHIAPWNVNQQGITMGMDGLLSGIELYLGGLVETGDINIFINVGAGWQTDTNDFETVVLFTHGWNYIDVTSANIYLLQGDQFALGVQGEEEEISNLGIGTGDQYQFGEMLLSQDGSPPVYQGAGYDFMFRTYVEPTIEITIDIKPGSDPNSINLSSAGVIPVAILSSETFDATQVDPETVFLAGAGVKMAGKSGKYLSHEEDVNGDGLLDLVCQVYTAEFMIETGDSIAVLEAETFDGTPVWGEDTIKIVPDD